MSRRCIETAPGVFAPLTTEADRLSEHADVPHWLAELVVMEANKHGMTLKQLRGPSRERDRVWVRRNISRIAHQEGFSFPQIGRALNRDHTTIVHLVRSGK